MKFYISCDKIRVAIAMPSTEFISGKFNDRLMLFMLQFSLNVKVVHLGKT